MRTNEQRKQGIRYGVITYGVLGTQAETKIPSVSLCDYGNVFHVKIAGMR